MCQNKLFSLSLSLSLFTQNTIMASYDLLRKHARALSLYAIGHFLAYLIYALGMIHSVKSGLVSRKSTPPPFGNCSIR